ncbi:hypothetical protein [Piscinibacterium candidicorallinum]|jgi:hypothetical protein|uniref:Uncharacterized protein n=1 Tax=Piscinibacterium candidicorallinum TaxID=1793872 RepID=A0ABV7H7Q5_9BURK
MKDTPYKKTAAGTKEMTARELGLGSAERRLLIMCDGKRTPTELVEFFKSADETLAMTQMLLDRGLIEPAGPPRAAVNLHAKAPGAAPSPPPPPPAPPAGSNRPVGDRGMKAARFVIEQLGPMDGEPLALKLEAAKTPEQLAAALTRAADVIAGIKGREVAAKLREIAG